MRKIPKLRESGLFKELKERTVHLLDNEWEKPKRYAAWIIGRHGFMLRVLRLFCSEYTGIPRRVLRRRVIRSNVHFKENFVLWTTDWKGGVWKIGG